MGWNSILPFNVKIMKLMKQNKHVYVMLYEKHNLKLNAYDGHNGTNYMYLLNPHHL